MREGRARLWDVGGRLLYPTLDVGGGVSRALGPDVTLLVWPWTQSLSIERGSGPCLDARAGDFPLLVGRRAWPWTCLHACSATL